MALPVTLKMILVLRSLHAVQYNGRRVDYEGLVSKTNMLPKPSSCIIS